MKRCLILLILFVALLYAEAPDPQAVVGKINEESYSYAKYNKIYNNYLEYYGKQQETPMSDEDKAKLNDRCWEELIGRYIYDEAIKAGKITLTNTELLAEAKKNPPAPVLKIKDLQSNGKLDKQKYEKALSEGVEFREAVLDEVRSYFQYTKLIDSIKTEVDVAEDSVRQTWVKDNDRVDAQIIYFDSSKMTSVSATEEEALQYYTERREEFRKDDCRKFHYVRFAKAGTAEDSLAIKIKVMKMYQDLLNGADFAQLARDNSQDTGSAQNGGDLGWFGTGKMVKPFEEAAFKTPVGQIAEPILTQFGWHIIQTTDRRTAPNGEEVSARHILLRINPSEAAVQRMKSKSTQLYELATQKGLPQAASEMGLKLEETPVFQAKDGFIRNIGREPRLIAFAFANPVGSVADIYYGPGGDVFICAVSAELPIYYTLFEEEKTNIQTSATRSKRGFYMNEYVQNFVKNLSSDQYLSWAERDSIMVLDLKNMKRGESITSIGKLDKLEYAVFNTPVGQFSPVVDDHMRWFLVKVIKHDRPDQSLWEKDKASLIQAARNEKQQKHLNDWYYEQRQKISITDNRDDFYDLSSNKKMQQLKL